MAETSTLRFYTTEAFSSVSAGVTMGKIQESKYRQASNFFRHFFVLKARQSKMEKVLFVLLILTVCAIFYSITTDLGSTYFRPTGMEVMEESRTEELQGTAQNRTEAKEEDQKPKEAQPDPNQPQDREDTSAEEEPEPDNTPIACKNFNPDLEDTQEIQYLTIGDRRPRKHQQCNQEPWVYFKDDKIYIDQEKYGPMTCTFEEVLFIDDTRNAPWQEFRSDTSYTLQHSDFVSVYCEHRKTYKKWQTVIMGGVKNARVWQHSGPFMYSKEGLKANILLWGFSSTSLNAFIREMPKSYAYMTSVLNGTVMKGYNIIGSGAKSNMVAMLTGQKISQWPSTELADPVGLFADDAYPLLWDEFRRYGYVTAFQEEQSTTTGVFNHLGRGFRYRPTDHYARPFHIQRDALGIHQTGCYMNITSNMMVQKYIKKIWSAYADRLKFFVNLQKEYSQNDESKLGMIDGEFRAFLKWLQDSETLENTILIIFGDYGKKAGSKSNTHQGRNEERRPLMYIKLPQWFRESNPVIVRNLEKNSELLTTPLDIAKTLKDILVLKKINFAKRQSRKKQALNLFRPVPRTRTCADAGIDPKWCPCTDWTVLDTTSDFAQQTARKVVEFINDYVLKQLKNYKKESLPSETCATLALDTVSQFIKLQGTAADGLNKEKPRGNETEYFELFFTTIPGGAKFEATVKIIAGSTSPEINEDSISRANVYRHHSFCIERRLPQVRKFCYCNKQKVNNGTQSGNNETLQQDVDDERAPSEEVKST